MTGLERRNEIVDALRRGIVPQRSLGSGKTFRARWLQERARRFGFATAEVQISETETRSIGSKPSIAA